MNLSPLQLDLLRAVEKGEVFASRRFGVEGCADWFVDPWRPFDVRTVRAARRRNLVFLDRHDDTLFKAGLTAEGQAELAARAAKARVASPHTRVDEARIKATPYAQRMRLATAEIYLALAMSHMLNDLADTDAGEEIAARYGLSRADLKILGDRVGARLEKLAVTSGYDMAWVDLDPVLNPSAA